MYIYRERETARTPESERETARARERVTSCGDQLLSASRKALMRSFLVCALPPDPAFEFHSFSSACPTTTVRLRAPPHAFT